MVGWGAGLFYGFKGGGGGGGVTNPLSLTDRALLCQLVSIQLDEIKDLSLFMTVFTAFMTMTENMLSIK